MRVAGAVEIHRLDREPIDVPDLSTPYCEEAPGRSGPDEHIGTPGTPDQGVGRLERFG